MEWQPLRREDREFLLGRIFRDFRLYREIKRRYPEQINYLRETSFVGTDYVQTPDDERLFGSPAILWVERRVEGHTWMRHKVGITWAQFNNRRSRLLPLRVGTAITADGVRVNFVAYLGINRHSRKEFTIYFDRKSFP